MAGFLAGLGSLGIAAILLSAGQVTVNSAEERLYSKGRAVVTATIKILYAVSALFALIGIALMGYYMFVLKN